MFPNCFEYYILGKKVVLSLSQIILECRTAVYLALPNRNLLYCTSEKWSLDCASLTNKSRTGTCFLALISEVFTLSCTTCITRYDSLGHVWKNVSNAWLSVDPIQSCIASVLYLLPLSWVLLYLCSLWIDVLNINHFQLHKYIIKYKLNSHKIIIWPWMEEIHKISSKQNEGIFSRFRFIILSCFLVKIVE